MNTTTWCWATLPRQGRDRPACQPGASSGVWLAALVAVALGLGGCDDPLDQEIDQDGDGYRLLQGDCDDRDPRVHPGARDGRNGKDDDCDGQTDEDAPLDDADEDGFRPLDGDCDDTRADVYPGAPESGDAVRDHDCDGHVGCPDPAPAGPPTVLASWPADDATVVPPLAQVVLRLSEPVRCSGPCLRLYGDPADGSPQLDQGGEPLGAFVLFDLPADLAVDRTYTVEIPGGPGILPALSRLPVTVGPRDFLAEDIPLSTNLTALRVEPSPRKDEEARVYAEILGRVDPDGIWLDGPFLRPVASDRRTSRFGDRRRYLYATGGTAAAIHAGIDFAAPTGTPVVAAGRGRVVLAADREVTGKTVVLEHLPGVYTVYMHLDSLSVAPGAVLERGARLGTVGSTGLATGPHLHWELRVRGIACDPETPAFSEFPLKALEP